MALALRARLQREGYDGIQLHDTGEWVEFDPTKVTSTGNRDTFDRGDPRLAFSKPPVAESEVYRAAPSRLIADRRTTVPAIMVTDTPRRAAEVGRRYLPITIECDVVRMATNGVNSAVPPQVMERLPEPLFDPAAVFETFDTGSIMVGPIR